MIYQVSRPWVVIYFFITFIPTATVFPKYQVGTTNTPWKVLISDSGPTYQLNGVGARDAWQAHNV